MRAMAAMMAALALGGALAGCTTDAAGQPAGEATTAETITYETKECYGACPVYVVTLDTATGTGMFEGRAATAVSGPRGFAATPAQVAAFRARLASTRGVADGSMMPNGARCQVQASDLPGAAVTWTAPGGATVRREVYFGCADDGNAPVIADLRAAPNALPIAALIGKR